jgi:tRNA-splicing ligase RtcB (3'-phosphate/5'-hydroxy nucleic acid ligase)
MKEKKNAVTHAQEYVLIANTAIAQTVLTDKTLQQIRAVSQMPGIIGKPLLLPDAHQGYGFPIGCVASFDAKKGIVSPGGIGFDINCGIRAAIIDVPSTQVKKVLPQLLTAIYASVPVGQGGTGSVKLTHEQLDEVCLKGMHWAYEQGYATKHDVLTTEDEGCLVGADPSCISPTAKARAKHQLGTLGAGNHFIEIQEIADIVDKQTARAYGITDKSHTILLIHSGSRGLGHQTCTEYLRKMQDAYPDIFAELPEKDLMYAPIKSDIGQAYLKAMKACANFAWVNRFMMMHNIRKCFAEFFPTATLKTIYDVTHNIAKEEQHIVDGKKQLLLVHRKGATRAFCATKDTGYYSAVGHPVLVPGSMGTASFILKGLPVAMDLTFGSCAHGSGRVMSRHTAVSVFNGPQIIESLAQKGILVKSPTTAIADEGPQVYKDSEQVIQSIVDSGIASVVIKTAPVGVIKG